VRPGLLKDRSVTDPTFANSPFHSEPSTSDDIKKRSKLALIKSKLSFKDLRKEASAEDISKRNISHPMPQVPDMPALPSSESSKRTFRCAASPGTLSSFAQSNFNLKAKLKPIDQGKVSGAASQADTAPSIELSPSETYTDAQGMVLVAPPKSPSRRVCSAGSQSSSYTQDSSKGKLDAEYRAGVNDPIGKRQLNLNISRTSMDIAEKTRTSYEAPRYPVTKDSPPLPSDLLEGSGKAKYLPQEWLMRDSAASIPPKPNRPAPTAYKDGEPPVTTIPDYLPSFKERLDKAGIPMDGLASPNHSIPVQLDDLVDMVRAIQKKTDTGVNNVTRKLDDLSRWIGDQLQSQVDSISDLARTKAELNNKQFDISREMMKFQMDVRLEIGVMERRLNTFEMKVMDEVQAEIRALGRSYADLNRRTESLTERLTSGDLQKHIECQHRKTDEIRREVAYLKAQDDKVNLDETQREQIIRIVKAQMESAKDAPLTFTPSQIELLAELTLKKVELKTSVARKTANLTPSMEVRRCSESTICSAPALIHDVDLDRALPLPPTLAFTDNSLPALPRVSSAQEPKARGTLPRSISMTKKGFMTGVKDAMTNASSPKEESPEKINLNEGKKWSVFGFRSRRDGHDSPAKAGKRSRSFMRRPEGTLPLDTGRSRSSTPTPSIPSIVRDIPKPAQKGNTQSTIHPALRVATLQNVVDSDEVLPLQDSSQPAVSAQPHLGYPVELSQSTHDSFPSTYTASTSFDEAHFQSATGSPNPAMQENQYLKPTAGSPAEHSLKMPLLSDTDHGWEQESVPGYRSNDTLN